VEGQLGPWGGPSEIMGARWLTRSGTRSEDGRAIREPPKTTSASISTSPRLPVSVIASAMNRVEIDHPQAATIQAGSNHRSAAPS
jgi:hypothetical protein